MEFSLVFYADPVISALEAAFSASNALQDSEIDQTCLGDAEGGVDMSVLEVMLHESLSSTLNSQPLFGFLGRRVRRCNEISFNKNSSISWM
jgi:hypothetical protein